MVRKAVVFFFFHVTEASVQPESVFPIAAEFRLRSIVRAFM